MELDKIFLDASIRTLELLHGRIQTCLDKLTDDQIWMRGGENENAIGNLVLHLCGNVRQWIGFGIGGKADVRMRDREFNARGGAERADLKERLRAVIEDAVDVLRRVDAATLAKRVSIQNYDISGLEAVFHCVQHFGQHTGQIILLTKAYTREDLGFYRHLSQAHGEKTP